MRSNILFSMMAMAIAFFVAGAGQGLAQTNTCGITSWDLTAGQTIKVGTVTVCNDANNIYVTYTLTYPGATFGNLHVWVGNSLLNLPANKNGTPIPGQFCNALGGKCYDATGLTTYTFTIPFSDLNIVDAAAACGMSLYVVTHAEVTMDSNSDGTMDHETAFGGGTAGGGPRWWFYGSYNICCDFGSPQSLAASFKTAYAKGGHVWTADRRSNPEKLPSLSLTQNRWGWAINLTSIGTTTYYDIWAGAALNDTSKGVKVGMLTIEWNGSQAVVKYQLFTNFNLEEVHLYAGDLPPATIAPGQYGYLDEFDPGMPNYTFTVPLTDANGTGGVWLVAHAVVSGYF